MAEEKEKELKEEEADKVSGGYPCTSKIDAGSNILASAPHPDPRFFPKKK